MKTSLLLQKRQIYQKNTKGFILTEMVVAIPLLIIISLFLAYLFIYQYWIFNTQNAELNITSEARIALDTVSTAVRGANRVLSSYSTYTAGPQTLILQVQSIDSSSQLISGINDTFVFYLSGTDLMMSVSPGSGSSRSAMSKTLATSIDVNSFAFSYDNQNYSLVKVVTTTIAVTADVRTQVGLKTRSIVLTSEAKLRNY